MVIQYGEDGPEEEEEDMNNTETSVVIDAGRLCK